MKVSFVEATREWKALRRRAHDRAPRRPKVAGRKAAAAREHDLAPAGIRRW
jgi:hypothetical protein